MKRANKWLHTVIATALLATTAMAAEKINGAGATFPAPLYFNWAYNYQKDTKIQVNYQSIGSGGGVKQITDRVVDFGASDTPTKDLKKLNLGQFPAVIGSICVVLNVPGIVDGQLKLKNTTVADIFMGKIANWNDPKIAADNAGVALPNQPITVVHRSDGSGTTENFTFYLAGSSAEWKKTKGTGKVVEWGGKHIGGKGNEGVSNLVKQTPYSIGYVENAYKISNKFSAAVLQTKSGKWVEAKDANFQAAAKNATWSPKDDFSEILILQNGDTSYPIVAATFILLPLEKKESNAKVINFFGKSFEAKGDKDAMKLGYIPLPAETKAMVRTYWDTIK